MTIADHIARHARERPGHPAVEDGDRVVTYGTFNGEVDEAAANLQAAGISPGDLVAVMLPNSAEHLVILCALARAGAVVFSLAPTMPAGEFGMAIAGLGVKALIAPAQRAPVSGLKNFTAEEICGPAPQPFAAPTVGDDDPYLLIQSSGTTGEPKSFIRSHGDANECIRRYAQNYHWTANDRTMSLVAMPFNVGRNVCLGTLRVGATVVVHRVSSIGDLVATMAGRRVTFLLVAPVQARQLLSGSDNEAPLFPGLRIMTVGSAPFTRDERSLARRRLSPNLHEQLGTNETGNLTIATPADQDTYPDAVGRLIEGIEAQIVDTDHRPLPPGEVGIARFRGPGFTTGYLDNPDANARAFRDGWYYSGDLAALNDEGYLFFKGRADDMITSGSVMFYPIEVENALLAHPDVVEAAAFGWPHKEQGEMAAAAVVTRSPVTAKELKQFCGRRIAGYKVPRTIMFMPNMPRNPMGKILKGDLKQVLRRKLEEKT